MKTQEMAPSLARSGWKLEIESPRSGKKGTFKKYFSKKQGCVIVGDTSNGGWNTLWKEEPDGSFRQEPRGPIALWLWAAVNNPADLLEPLGNRLAVSTHCRFCRRDLTDFPSVEAGYGPHCAKKHSLPWGGKSNG